MQAVLDAVVAREVAARLRACDNVIRAEGISRIWEGDGEHGRAAVLEGANYAAEGRDDGTVERGRKVLLYTIPYHNHVVILKLNNGLVTALRDRTHLRNSNAKFGKVSCIRIR